ncbi:hypothetical protein G7046_g5390 [Stylonectria norvegica]|nr:hypothetical protein G7046_g5390 [Stylonectria norvegica]
MADETASTTPSTSLATPHPTLRLLTIASFIPAFPLCLAHGILSHQPIPVVGLVPLAVSAAGAGFLLRLPYTEDTGATARRLAHPVVVFVYDVLLAVALMVVLVFTWIATGGSPALSMLAAYATMPLLFTFLIHLFLSLQAFYTGLAIHSLVQWLAWRALPPDCPHCDHRLRPSLPELPWLRHFQRHELRYSHLFVDDENRYRDDEDEEFARTPEDVETAYTAQPEAVEHARRYATEAGASGGSKTLLYVAGAAGVAGAGYWYLSGTPTAKKVEAEVKQAVGAEPKKAFVSLDQGFLSLKLAEVEDVNHNTKRFRFELPESDQVSGLTVASAVLTKFKDAKAEKPVLRPYTPISDENEKGFLDLLVKKYPDGPMSTHIFSLTPGDTLDIKGPLPKYEWTTNKHDHIALVAGGTGITPMYQLIRAIFNNPEDKTKVSLIFGNVTKEDILLKSKFEELENTYPQRFRAFYVLDKPPQEWAGNSGFISKELLKTVLPEPKSENVKVFVCGPPGLMNAISGNKVSPKDQGELSGALKELGYTSEQVYKF